MKKIYFALMAMVAVCAVNVSCNDEWEDELYEQLVSFKAVNGDHGVSEIYMRYKEDGTGTYNVPVIISGSRTNDKDYTVKISVDNDTLAILNSERFASGREDLWFKQLPEQYYSFPSTTCHIPAGSNTETYTINFNLAGIDLSENWVLPLTIDPDPSYKLNIRDGWYKALLNIKLFNDFSGTYSATSMYVYVDGESTDGAVEDERECRVVDDRSVFFYAGTIWSEDVNRNRYKVVARFEEGTTTDDGAITGNITLSSGDSENAANIEASGSCTYRYEVKQHATKKYIERRLTTMYLDYKYTDYTSDPSNPIRYHVKGNMTLEREYNVNIPDEEQAYLW